MIKHGMKGSTAYTCDGQKFSIKPFPVEARKGFGGGDGYGSGFLYGLYQGWEVIDCLEFGSAEASIVQIPFRDRTQYMHLLKKKKKNLAK